MAKRFGLLVFLVVVLAALLAVSAAAEGDWEYEVRDGIVILTGYTGSDTEVVIPEEIGGVPVRVIGMDVFPYEHRQTVTSVYIPDSVLLIQDSAFAYCEALESVRLPAGLMIIRRYVFEGTALKRIELPAHVWAIQGSAFQNCKALEEVVFPDGLEMIDSDVFRGCEKLRKAVLPEGFQRFKPGAFQGTDIPEEDFVLPEAMNRTENKYRYWYRAADAAVEETKDGVRYTYLITKDSEAAILNITIPQGYKKLVIPDKLGGCPVTGIYGTDLNQSDKLTVQLPKTLKEIGEAAFDGANGIEKITIPDSVVRIGSFAFEYCRSLKEIKLPAGLQELGYNVCGWTQVENFSSQEYEARQNGATVRDYYSSTDHWGYLDEADFTDGNGCYRVLLPEEGEEDRRIRLQFMRALAGAEVREVPETCLGLPVVIGRDSKAPDNGIEYRVEYDGTVGPVRIVDTARWDGRFPETALGMPVRADGATVTLETGGLSFSLTTESKQYKRAAELTLTGIDREQWDGTLPEKVFGYRITGLGPGVTEIPDGDMVFGYSQTFAGNDEGIALIRYTGNDREVTVPDTFLGLPVTRLGQDAFAGLEELETLRLPATIIELPSRCVHDCPKLTVIDMPEADKRYAQEDAFLKIGAKAVQYHDQWNGEQLVSTAEPAEGTDYALFADGTAEIVSLPEKSSGKVKIPSEVDGHTVVALGSSLFRFNLKVTGIEIPDTVEYIMGQCFAYSGIKQVTIPGSVKEIGSETFENASYLTKVTLNEGTEVIGERAFRNCGKLAAVSLPGTLKDIRDEAFENCPGLKEIKITGPVEKIGYCAFVHCTGLTAVTLPETLTDIGEGAFSQCWKLKKIEIPEGVTEIRPGTFYACSALADVKLSPRTKKIGDRAFAFCTKLKKIDIPEGAEVHENAFEQSGVKIGK